MIIQNLPMKQASLTYLLFEHEAGFIGGVSGDIGDWYNWRSREEG